MPILTALVLFSVGAVVTMLVRIDDSNDESRAEVETELLIGEMAAAVEEESVIIAAWTAEASEMATETNSQGKMVMDTNSQEENTVGAGQ